MAHTAAAARLHAATGPATTATACIAAAVPAACTTAVAVAPGTATAAHISHLTFHRSLHIPRVITSSSSSASGPAPRLASLTRSSLPKVRAFAAAAAAKATAAGASAALAAARDAKAGPGKPPARGFSVTADAATFSAAAQLTEEGNLNVEVHPAATDDVSRVTAAAAAAETTAVAVVGSCFPAAAGAATQRRRLVAEACSGTAAAFSGVTTATASDTATAAAAGPITDTAGAPRGTGAAQGLFGVSAAAETLLYVTGDCSSMARRWLSRHQYSCASVAAAAAAIAGNPPTAAAAAACAPHHTKLRFDNIALRWVGRQRSLHSCSAKSNLPTHDSNNSSSSDSCGRSRSNSGGNNSNEETNRAGSSSSSTSSSSSSTTAPSEGDGNSSRSSANVGCLDRETGRQHVSSNSAAEGLFNSLTIDAAQAAAREEVRLRIQQLCEHQDLGALYMLKQSLWRQQQQRASRRGNSSDPSSGSSSAAAAATAETENNILQKLEQLLRERAQLQQEAGQLLSYRHQNKRELRAELVALGFTGLCTAFAAAIHPLFFVGTAFGLRAALRARQSEENREAGAERLAAVKRRLQQQQKEIEALAHRLLHDEDITLERM